MMIGWVYDDGGRADAGYEGTAGDCVVRAIAIASGLSYQTVYDELGVLMRTFPLDSRGRRSPRDGVHRGIYDRYLCDVLGFVWTATMHIGSGCRVHLRDDELPSGRLVVRLSRHLAAVVDGVVYDTSDPSRGGTRCVYGYYQRAES